MIGIVQLLLAVVVVFDGPRIDRVDPPHWWSGMGVDTLELLVEGRELTTAPIRIDGRGVRLLANTAAQHPGYRYLTIVLDATAPAQTIRLIAEGASSDTFEFPLKERNPQHHQRIGLDQEDVMMLIMADRFSNADTSNDVVESMRETRCDRRAPYGRHGGDIAGVRQHIGYLDSLGIRAVWLCPVLENDQPRSSYHGYAMTDHYAIDARLGSIDDYRLLSEDLHRRSMRLVKDVVLNHVGDHHRFVTNPPDRTWINWWPEYTSTSGRENTNFDPYATEQDKRRFRQGWFDRSMPDLNTTNPHVVRYLIQNTLWWIEEADVDALRVDTYTYPDQTFMHEWTSKVRKTFPGIFIFGETWVDSHPSQAYYLESFPFNTASQLESVTDFQLYGALREVLTQPSGWDSGTGKLYRTLTADYLYRQPNTLVTFLDNHDLPRIAGLVQGNVQRLRIGLGLLMMLRGIPCLTYGTECGFSSTTDHGTIREDMPGGWPDDSSQFGQNAFTKQTGIDQWLRSLLRVRRQHSAMSTGRMFHITPQDGVYCVMRTNEQETIICIVNADEQQRRLVTSRLDDLLRGRRLVTDVLHQKPVTLFQEISLEPLSIVFYSVLEP